MNFQHKVRYRWPANPQGRATSTIPEGSFCLDCRYLGVRATKPRSRWGYCALLDIGDWMPGNIPLLFDGVKICGFGDDRGHRPNFRERLRRSASTWQWRLIHSTDPRDRRRIRQERGPVRDPRRLTWPP